MLKRFISIFLIGIILTTSIGTPTFADRYNGNSNFKEWDETHLVEPFKEWAIEFNEEIERDSVNNNNIYVENHLGEIQDTEAYIGSDGKTIIVDPPRSGYSSGYDYTLYIKNINSINRKPLEENIQMKFFVDDGKFREEIEYQEDIVELEGITIYDNNGYYKEIIMSLEEFEAQNLQEGSIMILNPTVEDIYGYAGKIVSFRIEGENVIIEAEEPAFEEVFAYIDIKGQQDISVEQMMDIQLREGIEARKYREYNRESQRYIEGVEYIFGSRGTNIADVGVEYGDFIIRGSIRVENSRIDFDIKTSFFGGLERFYLAYNADIVSQLEIEYKNSYSGDLDNNITLFRYPVPLGPTGLVADFKLDVYAQGNINASGKVEATVFQTTHMTLGARKAHNGNMEWIRNTTKYNPEFTSYIETEFRANAEAGISPSIELSFLGIISTDLQGKIGPYLKLDANASGGTNLSDGYFEGRLYAEVGVAFSSRVNLGDAFGLIDKTYSLGRTEIKIWSYIKEYNAETQGELQYIEFSIGRLNMKVNETKKLEVVGVYRNTVTGNIFESPIKDGVAFSISPSVSADIDDKGNIRILNDQNKELMVVARYKGKETSILVYVEENKEMPIDISKYKDMIVAGAFHTLALKEDSTVWAWGNNYFGNLGNGTNKDSHTPIQVKGLNDVVAIFDRNQGVDSLALRRDGTVWFWGNNYWGKHFESQDSNIPIQVEGLNGVTFITTGLYHLLALKEDGIIWGLGSNIYGQLGIDISWPSYYDRPVQVEGLNNVVSIDVYHHETSLAVKEDGTVWGWGYNGSGILGDERRNGSSNSLGLAIPVKIEGLSDVVSISSGDSYVAVLKGNGTVWAWGSNASGVLGDGTNNDSNTPVQVKGLNNVAAISASNTYVVALKRDGTVWTWGSNGFNFLGDGTNNDSNIPVQVNGLTNVVAISAGDRHAVALKNDGTVWAWGYNGEGQLGDGTTNSSNIPVKALIKLW